MNEWTIKCKRLGTVHIISYFAVCRNGQEIGDYYLERDLAEAYVSYMNLRATF